LIASLQIFIVDCFTRFYDRGKWQEKICRIDLGDIAISSIAAIVAYGSITPVQQRRVEAEDTMGMVVVTKTLTSIQDPGADHASHQVAMFLPPLGEDVVYG
jgi:hypothetical protein